MKLHFPSARSAAHGTLRFAVAALLASASPVTHALSITWVGTVDDWFDATKWNPAQVPVKAPPTPTNDVFVNNDGTATADSSSTFYLGSDAAANTLSVGAESSGPSMISGTVLGNGVAIDTNRLFVGSASGTVTDATGVVQVTGAGVNAPTQLAVGILSSLPSGFASGSVTVSGGDVRGTPVVGRTVLAGGDAKAIGRLSISNGNLLLSPGGFGPLVGVNAQSDGTADGRIDIVNGGISLNDPLVTNANLWIGIADGGVATGGVSAQTIDTSVNALQVALQVGVARNSGIADGTLSLIGGGTLRVAGDVVIGKSFAQAGGDAKGVANLAATQVEGPGSAGASFEVGSVNAAQLVNNVGVGTADGEARIAGSSAFQTYRVGSIIGTVVNDSVRADGVMHVGTGGLSAAPTNTGTLQIGVSQGTTNNNQLVGLGGRADGEVTVAGGDVSNFISIQVGRAVGFGAGTGSLEIADSNIAMGSSASFRVGTASNINGAITDEVTPIGQGEVIVRNSTLAFQPGNPSSSVLTVGEAVNNGSAANPSMIPVHAEGKLTLDNVTLTGGPVLRVGNSLAGFTSAPTTASGELHAIGGSMEVSSLAVGTGEGADGMLQVDGTQVQIAEDFLVGVNTGAQGQATIANAEVFVGTTLGVGVLNAPSSAPMSGRLALQSSTLDVAGNAFIGPQYQGGAGTLELSDSVMRVAKSMRVGQSSNQGTLFGDGTVSLTRSLVGVTDKLFLDIGSTLLYSIDGLTRVGEYGAIDVGTAQLEGLLSINLGLLPLLDSMHFDLMISSLLEGISGDFAAVNLQGLAPGYSASYGVVIDEISGQDVEIYRLSLNRQQIPEPTTLALFAVALGLLSIRCRAVASQHSVIVELDTDRSDDRCRP